MKLGLGFIFTDLSQHFGIYISWSLHNTLFATEAVFILEQITECRFRVLLDINDSCSSKLNVFSNMN